jgi:hypothetical protein
VTPRCRQALDNKRLFPWFPTPNARTQRLRVAEQQLRQYSPPAMIRKTLKPIHP